MDDAIFIDDSLLEFVVGTKLLGSHYGNTISEIAYEIAYDFVNQFKNELDSMEIIINTSKKTTNLELNEKIKIGIELYKLLIMRKFYKVDNELSMDTSDILLESAIINKKYNELLLNKRR